MTTRLPPNVFAGHDQAPVRRRWIFDRIARSEVAGARGMRKIRTRAFFVENAELFRLSILGEDASVGYTGGLSEEAKKPRFRPKFYWAGALLRQIVRFSVKSPCEFSFD